MLRNVLIVAYWGFVFFFCFLIGRAIPLLGLPDILSFFWTVLFSIGTWAIAFVWSEGIVDYVEYLVEEIIDFFRNLG